MKSRFHGSNIIIMKGIAALSPTSTFLCCKDLEPFAKVYNLTSDTLQVDVRLVKRALASNKSGIDSLAAFQNYLHSSQPAFKQLMNNSL